MGKLGAVGTQVIADIHAGLGCLGDCSFHWIASGVGRGGDDDWLVPDSSRGFN